MNARTATALFSLSLLAACTPGEALEDSLFATGSSSVVADGEYASLYAVNTDAGSLSRTAPGSTAVDELPLGLEPTRVARAGDKLFVTLRGERSVAIVQLSEAGPVLLEKVEVGAEPFGVVANEKGNRVYVSISQGNQVVEMNASGKITEVWDVPHEPRYLALHPGGKTLFVGTTRGRARLFQLDLTEGDLEQALSEISLPPVERKDANGAPVTLTPRITGDIAVSPRGDDLVVPVVYVDNKNPVADPETEGDVIVPVPDGYGSPGGGIDRFNPGVVTVPVAGGEADGEGAKPIFVTGFQQDITSPSGVRSVRSYPTSVRVSPDGLLYYVSFEGSDSLAVVGALPFDNEEMTDIAFPEPAFDGDFCCDERPGGVNGSSLPFVSVQEAGFAQHPKMFVRTGGWGPSGIALLGENEVWVHEAMSRAVSHLDGGWAFDQVQQSGINGFDGMPSVSTDDRSPALAAQVLPRDVFEGRRLFYSANNTSMVADGAGVSCATCHTDGRNDGLTWTFEIGLRQTPSLAGTVSQTAPVTWTDQVESVAHEAQITTEARMGGSGLSQQQLDQIAAYVDWTREVDAPDRGATSEAITRGKAIFERSDVGCADCHNGEAYTDNDSHEMYGLASVNTPTLRGIAGSAPYLHDGRAQDLRAVIEFSRAGEMGDTSMLSETEMDDLEAYLRSL